jgi:hypothetical protein
MRRRRRRHSARENRALIEPVEQFQLRCQTVVADPAAKITSQFAASERCGRHGRTTPFVDTRFDNPADAGELWVEVTDPREPLFGKRFPVESVARTPREVAHVFVRREDGVVLRVPLRVTNLSALEDHAPRAKLCLQSAQEFLSLVKEYQLCPTTSHKPARSGPASQKKHDRES